MGLIGGRVLLGGGCFWEESVIEGRVLLGGGCFWAGSVFGRRYCLVFGDIFFLLCNILLRLPVCTNTYNPGYKPSVNRSDPFLIAISSLSFFQDPEETQ